MYKLFNYQKIRKFFDVLEKMERMTSTIYINPNAKSWSNPNEPCYYCAREVFVNRTIAKWFKNKYLIVFENGYKKYLYVSHISYGLTWGLDLYISTLNYASFGNSDDVQEQISFGKKYSFNDLYSLEGIWCEDSSQHKQLLSLLKLDLPVLKFKYKVYNTDLLKTLTKKQTKSKDVYDYLTEYIEIEAMTENEAYKELKTQTKDKPNYILTNKFEII